MKIYNDIIIDSVLRNEGFAYWRRDGETYIYDKECILVATMTHREWVRYRLNCGHEFEAKDAPRGFYLWYK